MSDILKAKNIKKTYKDKSVLGNISVRLEEGELVSILGVSGVGKTTFFNILSGMVMPDSGNILLADSEGKYRDITGKTGELSYMLQKDLLLPHKKVIDNAALPLIIGGMSKRQAREKAAVYFGRFGLEGTEYKYPAQLSGGMRQRVALLRTYLCGKKVALLDEPFSALDAITRESMHEWYISVMSDIKLSTLFVTHDMDEAIFLSDRIYIMKGVPADIVAELNIKEMKSGNRDWINTKEFMDCKKRIREML